MLRIKIIASALCFLGIALSQNASAWDASISGQIDTITGTGAGGAPFRISLKGTPIMCNNNAWAYLNDADGNYVVNAALLLKAKSRGYTVSLWMNKDAGGYCVIGYFSIQ